MSNYHNSRRIWVDLDNSPHVPFFKPIIGELAKQGYKILITARNCAQTCGLADLHKLPYRRVGRHYGKNKVLKVLGTAYRALQMLPIVLKDRPKLALSHGSRSQMIAASLLRIPIIVILDYEHTSSLSFIEPSYAFMPEVVPEDTMDKGKIRIVKYPGIKEDVYTTAFKPDPSFFEKLNINRENTLVTIRPPATEAHYHNPESEILFHEVVEFLGNYKEVCMVILPRNEITQKDLILKKWPDLCRQKRIIIPDEVLNGLDLIWYSDLVVSGGGTMNREAAALGVPVYSIFRGEIGAVDNYLCSKGRLTIIRSVKDISDKLQITRREKSDHFQPKKRHALDKIVDSIASILK